MYLKVKFILSPTALVVLGMLCFQQCCSRPLITKSEPLFKATVSFCSLSVLCCSLNGLILIIAMPTHAIGTVAVQVTQAGVELLFGSFLNLPLNF